MKSLHKASLDACFAFIREFISANYRIVDLAATLGSSIAVVSLKTSQFRWKVSELQQLFEARGYHLKLILSPCVGDGKRWVRLRGGGSTRSFKKLLKLDCPRLRFLQQYLAYCGLEQTALEEMGGYQTVHSALNRDDMSFAALLKLVATLNAELLFSVTPIDNAARPRVGSLMLVRHEVAKYIKLECLDN